MKYRLWKRKRDRQPDLHFIPKNQIMQVYEHADRYRKENTKQAAYVLWLHLQKIFPHLNLQGESWVLSMKDILAPCIYKETDKS